MVLDVETPTHPDLTNRPLPSELEPTDVLDGTSDLRREELEEILQDSVWNEAFQEWAEYTDLTEAEYRTIHDMGLVKQLDFYWDPTEKRIRFEVPSLPDELAKQKDLATLVASELTDLSQTVIEMLEDAYVDWDEIETGDENWSEKKLSDETPLEDER